MKIKYTEAYNLLKDKSKTILKLFPENSLVSVRQGKARPTKNNPNPKLEDNRFIMFTGNERGENVRGPKPLFVPIPSSKKIASLTLQDCFKLREIYWKEKAENVKERGSAGRGGRGSAGRGSAGRGSAGRGGRGQKQTPKSLRRKKSVKSTPRKKK